jgi:hypothetical protein
MLQDYPAKSCKSLSSTSRHRARRVGHSQLAGAAVAKPDENVRRIGPKERTHFSRHSDRVVHTEPLQSLHVKYAIVEITRRTFIPVNTLPLAKRLPSHDESPYFPAPHRAKYRTVYQVSGVIKM